MVPPIASSPAATRRNTPAIEIPRGKILIPIPSEQTMSQYFRTVNYGLRITQTLTGVDQSDEAER